MKNPKRRWRRIADGHNPINLNPTVVRFTHVNDTRYTLVYQRSVRDGIGTLLFTVIGAKTGTVVAERLDWHTALNAYMDHKANVAKASVRRKHIARRKRK